MTIGNISVPSITNATSIFPSRSDSTSVQSQTTDVANQSATVAGGAAGQGVASGSPLSSTTQNVIFDPALLEMIYEELDARTNQLIGQIPLVTSATNSAYPQTRATANTTPRLSATA